MPEIEVTESLLLELLTHNKQSVHPGKGKQNAALVRNICLYMNWNEDEFLPSYVIHNKKEWLGD